MDKLRYAFKLRVSREGSFWENIKCEINKLNQLYVANS